MNTRILHGQWTVHQCIPNALNISTFYREAPKRSESFHSTSKDDSAPGPRSRYAYHDSRNNKDEGAAPPPEEESSRPSFTRGGSGRYTGRQRINRQRTAAAAAAAAGTAFYTALFPGSGDFFLSVIFY